MDTPHIGIGKVPGAALFRVQQTCADLPQNQADSRCRPNAATLSAAHQKAQGRVEVTRCIATRDACGHAGAASHSTAAHVRFAR